MPFIIERTILIGRVTWIHKSERHNKTIFNLRQVTVKNLVGGFQKYHSMNQKKGYRMDSTKSQIYIGTIRVMRKKIQSSKINLEILNFFSYIVLKCFIVTACQLTGSVKVVN